MKSSAPLVLFCSLPRFVTGVLSYIVHWIQSACQNQFLNYLQDWSWMTSVYQKCCEMSYRLQCHLIIGPDLHRCEFLRAFFVFRNIYFWEMYQNINWSLGLYQTQTHQTILFSPHPELWRGQEYASVWGFGSHWLFTAPIILRSQWLLSKRFVPPAWRQCLIQQVDNNSPPLDRISSFLCHIPFECGRKRL